jgi:lipopolysaccharide transport system ATP-binding protein
MDTPVKHYSSGMYVRLAFAVAAHLEPEILLVDEVLAVGDAAFQKKCLGKMGDVAKEGRTVLFVSHNMVAVRSLCGDAILLGGGQITARGPAYEITERYLKEIPSDFTQADIPSLIRKLPPDPVFRLHSIAISQNGLSTGESIVNAKPIELEITYEVLHKVSGLRVYIDLCDEYGDLLLRSYHDEDVDEIPTVLPGSYVSTVIIPADFLAPKQYKLIFWGTIHDVRSCTPGGIAVPLTVVNTGRKSRAYADEPLHIAKLAPILEWRTRPCTLV